jgi:superfamily II DNA or RNA helicase
MQGEPAIRTLEGTGALRARGGVAVRRLRAWQVAARQQWETLGRPRDFLTEATPGAGKTTFALHLIRHAWDSGAKGGGTLCIVSPTAHLRRQWQLAAHRDGFDLCTDMPEARLERPYCGVSVTYQQVLANPDRFRRAFENGWVVPDECHHAGEGKSWAEALEFAFEGALHRLSLSGTAFRSDNCRIPFIRYGDDGLSAADYRYAYGDALRDGIVRPVYFVSFGGDTSWSKGGEIRTATFREAVSREDSSARLRTALDAAGGWMRHAVERAHQRLIDCRRAGHPDAGGLVVCMDQGHARRVAACLREVAGVVPALALSDDPDSSSVIARFAASREPWIVAVRQVSEGTDIPRLRVGIWATNASTELFFRQVVGRLVRVVAGLREQDAFLYLPADPGLLRHARALADERAHQVDLAPSGDADIQRQQTDGPGADDFRTVGSTATDAEVVFGSRVVGPAELERARALAVECGIPLEDPIAFALALREAAGPGGVGDVTLEAKRRALRALLSRRVREYAARSGAAHRDTYARLKRSAGRPVGRLDEVWLARHVRTVEGWIERTTESPSGRERVG